MSLHDGNTSQTFHSQGDVFIETAARPQHNLVADMAKAWSNRSVTDAGYIITEIESDARRV
jgi:hypothetical protein